MSELARDIWRRLRQKLCAHDALPVYEEVRISLGACKASWSAFYRCPKCDDVTRVLASFHGNIYELGEALEAEIEHQDGNRPVETWESEEMNAERRVAQDVPADPDHHGWSRTGSPRRLHVAKVHARKSVALYSVEGTQGKVLGYFRNEEAAREFTAILDEMMFGSALETREG